jgi:ActR/RegA family two-component response regulator
MSELRLSYELQGIPSQERWALVVDDDAQWRTHLAIRLRAEGLEVDTSESMLDAEWALDRRYYYLAILDLALNPNDVRNRDGLRLAKKLFQMKEGTAFIILTGFGSMDVGREATLYGAVDAMSKGDFRHASFLAQVHVALNLAKQNHRSSCQQITSILHRIVRGDWLSILYPSRDPQQPQMRLDNLGLALMEGLHPFLPPKFFDDAQCSIRVPGIHTLLWSKVLTAAVEVFVGLASDLQETIGLTNTEFNIHPALIPNLLRVVQDGPVVGLLIHQPSIEFEDFERPATTWMDAG